MAIKLNPVCFLNVQIGKNDGVKKEIRSALMINKW